MKEKKEIPNWLLNSFQGKVDSFMGARKETPHIAYLEGIEDAFNLLSQPKYAKQFKEVKDLIVAAAEGEHRLICLDSKEAANSLDKALNPFLKED